MKIFYKKDLELTVKEQLNFISSNTLLDMLAAQNISATKKTDKDVLIKLLMEHFNSYYNIYIEYPQHFGMHPSDVESLLSINSRMRKKMIEHGLLEISLKRNKRLYGKTLEIGYISLNSLYKLSEKQLALFVLDNYRKPTEKQLKGYERADETRKRNKKIEHLKGHLIDIKDSQEYITSILNDKDNLIIDVASTGLSSNSEVIEIAIIDMKGNILLNSLVSPSENVGIEMDAHQLHKLSKCDLVDAPKINELNIKNIIKGKNIYSYSPDTDLDFIKNSGLILDYNLYIRSIMDIASSYIGATNIGLNSALSCIGYINKSQSYRAANDALDALLLLNVILNDCNSKVNDIESEINNLKQI